MFPKGRRTFTSFEKFLVVSMWQWWDNQWDCYCCLELYLSNGWLLVFQCKVQGNSSGSRRAKKWVFWLNLILAMWDLKGFLGYDILSDILVVIPVQMMISKVSIWPWFLFSLWRRVWVVAWNEDCASIFWWLAGKNFSLSLVPLCKRRRMISWIQTFLKVFCCSEVVIKSK